jgi:serine/threonine protein phosphatase PrpC
LDNHSRSMRLSALFARLGYQRNIRRSFSALALVALLQAPVLTGNIYACDVNGTSFANSYAAYAESQTLTQLASAASDSANSSFSSLTAEQQYSQLTKQILLAGIELERFSLNFRLESAKQPRFRKLRYFLTQETAAATGLGFEIAFLEQAKKGRRRPLQVSKPVLHGALTTAMTGAIIGGSGSALELSSNMLQAIKNKRHGFDFKTANKFVAAKLKEIDLLLAQRDALVAANPEHPGHEGAVLEGKILRELRNCFISEYSDFNADTKGYITYQNLFYLLNASYSAVQAAGAWCGYRGVTKPKYNGPANVLFVVSGAMAMVTPIISTAAGKYARKKAYETLEKQIGEKPKLDEAAFSADTKRAREILKSVDASVISSLPGTDRLALYTDASVLFKKQLDSETTIMRRNEKVALQNNLLAPVIGAQLMTQGIFGCIGSYRYNLRPRKQLSMFYRGAIVGTVGTSMATLGNAVSLLSTLSYEHRLSKENKMPAQLIKSRLEHLEEVEKEVRKI